VLHPPVEAAAESGRSLAPRIRLLSQKIGARNVRLFPYSAQRAPWNKGKLIGQKPSLKLREIWAIRMMAGTRWPPSGCRTKADLIHRRTKNLRAVQILLGHTRLESTVRYLGIGVGDALEMAEQTDILFTVSPGPCFSCPVSSCATHAVHCLVLILQRRSRRPPGITTMRWTIYPPNVCFRPKAGFSSSTK
jgi:hypothetical protein